MTSNSTPRLPKSRNPNYRNPEIPLLRRSTAVNSPLIQRSAQFRVPGVRYAKARTLCPLHLPVSELPKYRNGISSPLVSQNLIGSLLPFHVSPSPCFGFSPLTVSRSLSLETSETPNSEVPKNLLCPHTKTSFSRFGDLISQGFWLTLRTFEPRNAEMIDVPISQDQWTPLSILAAPLQILRSLAISGILLGEFSTVQISSSKISGSKLTLRLSSGTYPSARWLKFPSALQTP
jgi:hypothetical protein